MNQNRQAKVWEQLQRSDRFCLEGISVESSPVFAPQDIKFGQLTVLTGAHGTGKSYLMKLVTHILGGHFGPTDSMTPPFTEGKADNAAILRGDYTPSYRNGESTVRWAVKLVPGEQLSYLPLTDRVRPFPQVWLIDPTIAFGDYSAIFKGRHGPEYIGDWQELRQGELVSLNAILGRSYQRFAWRDLGFAYENLPTPDFEATHAERSVTTQTMSSAELWVHYCLWRLRSATPGVIVVIDEPETFLSPAGHGAFLDEIARITLASGAQTIIATHSAAMITRAPSQSLRVHAPGPAGTRVIRPANSTMTLRLLGHEPGLVGIVLVEDTLAREIVAAVLARFDRELADRVDVIEAGGRDRALAAGRVLARSGRLVACVVLDGDQRDTRTDTDEVPVAYLPGGTPDDLLLEPVRVRPELLADRIGADIDDVALAIDATRFRPHQNWFGEIGRRLGAAEPVVVAHLISAWLADDAAQAQARALVRWLRTAMFAPDRLRSTLAATVDPH